MSTLILGISITSSIISIISEYQYRRGISGVQTHKLKKVGNLAQAPSNPTIVHSGEERERERETISNFNGTLKQFFKKNAFKIVKSRGRYLTN